MKGPKVEMRRLLLLSTMALPTLAHADEPAPSPGSPAASPAADTAPRAKTGEPTTSHLGVDGILSAGLASFAGASMRFEVQPGTSTSLLARVGYLRGEVLDDESFQAGTFSLGYRRFLSRRSYLGLEGMLIAYDEENMDWEDGLGVSSSLGLKLGAIDTSVQVAYPFASLGINVGADFATF